VGVGVFLAGQQGPYRKGAGPSSPNFGGSFLFMRIHFVAELPNFTR